MSAEPDPPPAAADGSSFFDLLPIGAYRARPDGRLLRVNAALARLNGYRTEAEQLASAPDVAREWYVDPTRHARLRERLDTAGEVRDFVSEVRRLRTRQRIWVSENAQVVRDADGQVLFHEGTVHEVPARAGANEAVARNDARLRLISDEVPGVVFIVRLPPDGVPHFEFISAGVRELYGVDPEEVRRDGRTLQRMRHPDDDARVAAAVGTATRSPSRYTDEFRIVRRDGSLRWVRASSAPILRDAYESWRCGVIVDITDRQQARELRAERDQARAARRATIGLLSRVSHELRTPLNAVLGFTQLLEQDPALDARQRGFAAEAVRAGRHLLSLVDDVLDLSLAEGGAVSLQPARLDLQEALSAAHALLASTAAEAGIGLRLPAGPLPALRADPTRLRQVLVNLLSNAIKYNRPGGTVEVAVPPVGASEPVAVTVRDEGPGLDAAQQSRLFEPFERLGAERGTVAGTGLGLAVSRQLARAMGGDIEVSSVPGRGTCFTLRLPAA